ncbi:uncharacterized protein LOC121727618 isoform X1 [Aricia agestis]|uniref:uncharacterized protein LOC121727618 isoform X1 n=2 Tax=Aricia agestis TaxID=91739 RepID=UPI001C204B0D|nr:uncharacterized protein LOC121727618 isoform X1 [Aricia agestis]
MPLSFCTSRGGGPARLSLNTTSQHGQRMFSNFCKLQRVMAYIQRFLYNCRHSHNKYTGHLTVKELVSSNQTLCKLAQMEIFPKEYSTLSKNNNLPAKNCLQNMRPFMHNDGLIRVGGRLSNSEYCYDTKHPIILHASHHLTKLIFQHYHILTMHAGPQHLLSTIRQKYWPIAGRNLARKTVHDCIKCCRFAGRSIQPVMGNLPKERLSMTYPFLNVAVDYAGPILIADKKGRGCKLIKSWICVFVCLAVKAVHVELVTDLSKDGFLAALQRFVARRGKPISIYSDNGTNFTAASRDLARFLKASGEEIGVSASELAINFKFSPAYSPHFNGLAEAAVKSIKHHLKRVLTLTNLTYEEMYTLLVGIEGILNSRPITPLSSDPTDLIPLTPSHFLIGRTMTNIPEQIDDQRPLHLQTRYERISTLKGHFWKRFYKEYFAELQCRQKWKGDHSQLHLGEMVLVKDDRLPPNRWLLGRVVHLYPGSDGIARVADIQTTSGTLRRAYNRLCPLPVLESSLPTGPACEVAANLS